MTIAIKKSSAVEQEFVPSRLAFTLRAAVELLGAAHIARHWVVD
jgi:hypothetical protein